MRWPRPDAAEPFEPIDHHKTACHFLSYYFSFSLPSILPCICYLVYLYLGYLTLPFVLATPQALLFGFPFSSVIFLPLTPYSSSSATLAYIQHSFLLPYPVLFTAAPSTSLHSPFTYSLSFTCCSEFLYFYYNKGDNYRKEHNNNNNNNNKALCVSIAPVRK